MLLVNKLYIIYKIEILFLFYIEDTSTPKKFKNGEPK